MSRTKTGFVRRRWHKKLIKSMKGQFGTRGRLHRRSNEAMLKSLWYSYRDRKARRRDMRRLWIVRINAGARANGLTYGQLISGLKAAGAELDRKSLAELAARHPAAFASVAAQAKAALPAR